MGRQAEQPLHVSNRAARRRLHNKHAATIAATASNSHLDRMWRENGACSVGGGGRLLHRTIAISSAARERDRERERGREIEGATKAGRVDSMPILMSSERALYLELRCRLSLRKHLVAA